MRRGCLRRESLLAGRLWLQPSLVLIALALTAAVCGWRRCAGNAWSGCRWPRCGCCSAHGAKKWSLIRLPAPALAALSDGLLRTVEGTVVGRGPGAHRDLEQNVDEPSATSPSERVDLRVESVEVVSDESDAQALMGGGVRLTVRWPAGQAAQAFKCGDRVRAVVRLLPPETYHDPGVWSRADFLLDEGITSTATVTIDRVDRLGRTPGAFVRAA